MTLLTKMESKPLLCLLFAITMTFCFGQDLPKIIPASPNTASLGKYLETPVSYETGIPNIKVPIYTIKEGDVSLPISLSYHAGGIKVEEVASWVGLGWSLNVGGLISRTTKGLPDDTSINGYMYTQNSVQDLKDLPHNSSSIYNMITNSLLGYQDYEPDIFSFNFGGYSGKFSYDQISGVFFQMPYSNIKITPIYENTGGKITSWVFTTPDGVKYYFGISKDQLRTATDFNSNSFGYTYSNNNYSIPSDGFPLSAHITSWHLMDIVSPTTKHIKFVYQKQNNIKQTSKTGETYTKSCGENSHPYSVSFVENYLEQSVIKEIVFSNGKVEFIEDINTRTDLSGAKALKSIKIYTQNNILKSYNLNYDYTMSPIETGKWINIGDKNQRRYRLRLLTLEEENSIGEKLPPFSFEYNNIPLPSRFSNAQDYWGYYNAMTSNTSLIPEVLIGQLYLGEANRTVDTLNSQAGMLNKITYPTGGSTEYLFESNTASNIISKISTYYNIRNRGSNNYFSFIKAPANENGPSQYAKEFTIAHDLIEPTHISVSVTGCANPDQISDFSCDYVLKIKGVTDPLFNLDIGSTSFTYKFPVGTYRIEALEIGLGENTDTSDFSYTMNWWEDAHPEYLNVGGQRIKKIILNDGSGTVIEKRYRYNYLDNNLTSGTIISTPVFLDTDFFNGTCSPPGPVSRITSYSQAPSVFVKGNVMGYSNVTELRSDNVKTEYSFSFSGDFQHYTTYPGLVHLPDLYIGWIRGNLLKKEEFSIKNGFYRSVSRIENEYERVGTTPIVNHGLNVVSTISGNGPASFKYGFYSAVSEWYRIHKTTSTSFFDNNKEVISIQDFTYNNNPLLASKSKITTSDSKPIITKNYYPEDVDTITSLANGELSILEKSAIDRLKTNDLHQISIPIQIEKYKDKNGNDIAEANELLSVQRTNYKDWGNDIVLPKDIETLKGIYSINTNELRKKIVFHHYYSNGNIKEISKKDGTKIVYIWGYNNQFPVAKVENTSYSAIEALSTFDVDFDLGAGGLSTQQANSLRNDLTAALVTTYTYDPLIGLISTTDPRGTKTYYSYDSFNRLKNVKDADGNLITNYNYHYKNQ